VLAVVLLLTACRAVASDPLPVRLEPVCTLLVAILGHLPMK
jgi:hypothetical protein